MARLYTGSHDIISLRNSYHGNAAGTMGATAQKNWKFNVIQVKLTQCVHNFSDHASDVGSLRK
jgi:alanine-glyoxylate transaminase/(R)-3-amino-2-methylpropionate-pyruvate transaminase